MVYSLNRLRTRDVDGVSNLGPRRSCEKSWESLLGLIGIGSCVIHLALVWTISEVPNGQTPSATM
jgi:hypothetical protein